MKTLLILMLFIAPAMADETNAPVKVHIIGTVLQVLDGGRGLHIQNKRDPMERIDYGNAQDKETINAITRQWEGIWRAHNSELTGDIILIGHPDAAKLADGDTVNVWAVEDGIFRTDTVLGAAATLHRYAVTTPPPPAPPPAIAPVEKKAPYVDGTASMKATPSLPPVRGSRTTKHR